jgi:signal transduction histidine kinase
MAGIIITNPLIITRQYHLLWEKVNICFVIWIPSLYLIWASRLSKKKLKIKEKYLIFISLLFSLSLLTNIFVKDILIVNGKYEEVLGPVFILFSIYYFICFIYGLLLLYSSYRIASVLNYKRRNILVFIGTLIPICTSIMINFVFRFIEKYSSIPSNIYILPFTNSFMMAVFAYAILKHGFLKQDISLKEKLDTLRIKIIYIANTIIVGLSFIIVIIFIQTGYPIDYAVIETFFISLIIMILIGISINYSLSKYINEKIIIPIEKISQQAIEVGKGNFSMKVGFEGEDEIAFLSRQMDEMTEKLDKTSQIRENFNKALQIEVQNKTEKLQEAYNQLKDSDKAKKDFIDAIAHELYNPLAIISASNEFIDVSKIDNENKKMIISIQRNIQRVLSLVKEIEDFVLLDFQDQKLNFEKFDLGELLELIAQDFVILANKRKIEISIIPIGKDFYLEGDKEKLAKVFVNLIENALNFSNENGKIYITIKGIDHKVEVKIEDRGIGIKDKDINNIFQKYYRAEVDDELKQGIGLGLPISLDIVTKHEGIINVESEHGKGSTFTVILPRNHVIL